MIVPGRPQRWACLVFLFVVALVSTADAQRGRGPFGFRARFLIELPEVRTELGVGPEQQKLLDDLQADLSDQMRAIMAEERERGPLRDPEAQQSRTAELREKIETLSRRGEELIETVLEPPQVERLSQLRLQRDGLRALDRPELVSQLALSDVQLEQLQKLREAAAEAFAPGFDPQRFRELRDKQEAEFLEVLTQEQQATWQKLKGKPFSFPTFQRFGRTPRRND